jgi:hypothetical protein
MMSLIMALISGHSQESIGVRAVTGAQEQGSEAKISSIHQNPPRPHVLPSLARLPTDRILVLRLSFELSLTSLSEVEAARSSYPSAGTAVVLAS